MTRIVSRVALAGHVTAFLLCLAPVTSSALTLLPGEQALWHFVDPGPLSPAYDAVLVEFSNVDLGLLTPTGVQFSFYDDFPVAQPWEMRITYHDWTGLQTFTCGGGTPNLWDDPEFFVVLANTGAHSFSLPETQVGKFLKDGQEDVVRANPIPLSPIPEPATCALLALGLVGLGLRARRRMR